MNVYGRLAALYNQSTFTLWYKCGTTLQYLVAPSLFHKNGASLSYQNVDENILEK